jgi:hypothetical protein
MPPSRVVVGRHEHLSSRTRTPTNQHEKRAVGQRQAESGGLAITAGVTSVAWIGRSIDRSGFVPALGSRGARRHFADPVKAACASARGNKREI